MTRGRKIVAIRLLRSLATIETLSALGHDDEVCRLLAGIDAEEARDLAFELDAELDAYVPTERGVRLVISS